MSISIYRLIGCLFLILYLEHSICIDLYRHYAAVQYNYNATEPIVNFYDSFYVKYYGPYVHDILLQYPDTKQEVNYFVVKGHMSIPMNTGLTPERHLVIDLEQLYRDVLMCEIALLLISVLH